MKIRRRIRTLASEEHLAQAFNYIPHNCERKPNLGVYAEPALARFYVALEIVDRLAERIVTRPPLKKCLAIQQGLDQPLSDR